LIPSHTNLCRMKRNELLPDFNSVFNNTQDEKDYKTIVLLVLGIFILAWQALPSLFSTPPAPDTLTHLPVIQISGNYIQDYQNPKVQGPLPNHLRPLFFQPISINESDLVLLQSIPGIGPHLSEQIVRYRNMQGEFADLHELLNVHGIGEKKLSIIKKYVML
jgi:competence ComEA-like helix-hairpin-helix protein